MMFIFEILLESMATVGLWLFMRHRFQKNPNFLLVVIVAVVMIGATVAFNGFHEVDKGQHGVESLWGQLDYDKSHPPGWTFIAPWRRMEYVSANLENVHPENSEDHAMHIFSKDRVPLKASVSFSVVVTKRHVGRVMDGIGMTMDEVRRELLMPSAEAAVSNSGGSIVAHDIWSWADDGHARIELQNVVLENFLKEIVRQLQILPQFSDLPEEELREVFHVSAQLSSVIPGKEVEDALSANAATEQLRDNQSNLQQLAIAEQETMSAQGKALRSFIDELGSDVSLADVAAYNLAVTLEKARQKDALPQQLSWQVNTNQRSSD